MSDSTDRRQTCRYIVTSARGANRCTAEAVDPEGEIVLCVRHLGRAMEFLARIGLVPGVDPDEESDR